MNRKIAIILIRLVGSLLGLMGLGWIVMFSILLVGELDSINPRVKDEDASRFFLSMMLMVIIITGFFLLYVAYSVWFKFGPKTIQSFVSVLALFTIALSTNLVRPEDGPLGWSLIAWLGIIVLIYFVYKIVHRKLNEWLFRDREAEVTSENRLK